MCAQVELNKPLSLSQLYEPWLRRLLPDIWKESCFRRALQHRALRLAFAIFTSVTLHSIVMAQTSHTPNLEAQRAAMKKLSFLIGEWSGEASAIRGPGPIVELTMTEAAAFKLDGLVLMIEGVGRTKSDTKPSLQALGLVSFDDAAESYQMRAYNDGRWLETEVKLLDDGKSLSWGFTFRDISTKTLLRINERGEWTEHAEYIFGARAPQKLMDLVVRRVSRK